MFRLLQRLRREGKKRSIYLTKFIRFYGSFHVYIYKMRDDEHELVTERGEKKRIKKGKKNRARIFSPSDVSSRTTSFSRVPA